jgi:hypothetical protein
MPKHIFYLGLLKQMLPFIQKGEAVIPTYKKVNRAHDYQPTSILNSSEEVFERIIH